MYLSDYCKVDFGNVTAELALMEPIFIETSFLDEVIFFKDAPKIQMTAASDDFPYHVQKSAQASWNR